MWGEIPNVELVTWIFQAAIKLEVRLVAIIQAVPGILNHWYQSFKNRRWARSDLAGQGMADTSQGINFNAGALLGVWSLSKKLR